MQTESTAGMGRRVVIDCRVMGPELTRNQQEEGEAVEVVYLDQTLHCTPSRLLDPLQEKIDQVARTASRIVLGYGLCSNGVVGVQARQQGLIIPAAMNLRIYTFPCTKGCNPGSVRSRNPFLSCPAPVTGSWDDSQAGGRSSLNSFVFPIQKAAAPAHLTRTAEKNLDSRFRGYMVCVRNQNMM
jgi:hypothetical protein